MTVISEELRKAACRSVEKHGTKNVPIEVRRMCAGLSPKPEPIKPAPRDKWPIVVRAVARLRVDADKGLGDTIARIADKVGGNTLADWYERITGENCGCADRHSKLNAKYPYPAKERQ